MVISIQTGQSSDFLGGNKTFMIQTEKQKKPDTKTMALAAVFTALTYVFTAFINIRLPITANGGLIHLGNIPLFIGAVVFGSSVGALSLIHI